MSNVRGHKEILKSLSKLQGQNIIYNALKRGAYLLRQDTKTSLKNTDLNLNSDQLNDGVQMKMHPDSGLIRVYLKPRLFMHWFESGTAERYNKNGRYTGAVRPRNFFEDARQNEQAIFDAIERSIDDQLKLI